MRKTLYITQHTILVVAVWELLGMLSNLLEIRVWGIGRKLRLISTSSLFSSFSSFPCFPSFPLFAYSHSGLSDYSFPPETFRMEKGISKEERS
jgi:hypothetical protein